MKLLRKPLAATLCALLLLPVLSGCSAGDKTIIRIGHNQATDHPTNIALLAFEEFIVVEALPTSSAPPLT